MPLTVIGAGLSVSGKRGARLERERRGQPADRCPIHAIGASDLSLRLAGRQPRGLSAGNGRQGSMKLARSAPAPSYALEFPGRWDRCFRRLWLRNDHSNAG